MIYNILHVEDDDTTRENIALILLDIAKVHPAATIQEAVREYKPEVFDLVICDGTLERVHDGVHFAAFVVTQKGGKVLVLSGDVTAEKAAKELGLPFMYKLDAIENLESKVKELLGL
jgi:DNA-binding NtrC family response regulator